jgi:phospholipid/cholesterol/gamma-HCH transport system substrate-binding protein
MERNAHYALVGLISVILLMATVVFVFWLARFQFTKQYDIYDVDFKGPVNGLSVGGEVYFNGIKVGEVTKLSLDKLDPNRVVARVRTSSDAPVREDSLATLEPLGITGVNFIQISAGTVSKPLLKDTVPSDVVPVIHTKEGALESLLQGGGDVLTRTVQALDRVNKLLSDENISNISGTFSDVRAVADELKDQRRMLEDVDKAVQSLDQTSQHIRTLTDNANDLLNGDGRRTLKNAADAAEQLKEAATEVKGTLGKVQGPTTDFATNGLPRISSAIISLQTAAESLNRVVNDIEQNPQGLIAKPPAKEMKVNP